MSATRGRCMTNVCLAVLAWTIVAGAGSESAAPVGPPGENPVELADLQTGVDHLAARVTDLAGAGNLLDTLHFGWFDRPYARATLAVLVKTTRALEREARLRDHGNGAIPDDTLRRMMGWAQQALERVVTGESLEDFRPHRIRVTGAELAEASATPALFAFVDRATATRLHRVWGDLDLLAAMGFRVYPRLADEGSFDGPGRVLVDRAHSLGLATALVADSRAFGRTTRPSRTARTVPVRAEHTVTVGPLPLRALLQRGGKPPVGPGRTIALIDSVRGESWPSSLARRALARGRDPAHPCFVAEGWMVPQGIPFDERLTATATAMWVHAIDGQSLGLIHGWRDLRDGSARAYSSVLLDPARIEVIAHTSLDLIRHGEHIKLFRSKPLLAVAVSANAVDPQHENTWAAWIEPVWATLLDHQIRFDVVPLGRAGDHEPYSYPVVIPLRSADAADPTSLILQVERSVASHPEHTGRITVRELDGSIAPRLFVRSAPGRGGPPEVVVANLCGHERQLKLHGFAEETVSRDLLSGLEFRDLQNRFFLGPWQIRVFQPVMKTTRWFKSDGFDHNKVQLSCWSPRVYTPEAVSSVELQRRTNDPETRLLRDSRREPVRLGGRDQACLSETRQEVPP